MAMPQLCDISGNWQKRFARQATKRPTQSHPTAHVTRTQVVLPHLSCSPTSWYLIEINARNMRTDTLFKHSQLGEATGYQGEIYLDRITYKYDLYVHTLHIQMNLRVMALNA